MKRNQSNLKIVIFIYFDLSQPVKLIFLYHETFISIESAMKQIYCLLLFNIIRFMGVELETSSSFAILYQQG